MKTILITAGGTSEPIDNIRSITNTGTGTLGSIIADRFARKKNVERVVYIHSKRAVLPKTQKAVLIEADSTAELQEAVRKACAEYAPDAIIHSMAVSDYRTGAVVKAEDLLKIALRIAGTASQDELERLSSEVLEERLKKAATAEELAKVYEALPESAEKKPAKGAAKQAEKDSLLKLAKKADLRDKYNKIPSSAGNPIILLEPTPKIIPELRQLAPNAIIVGFKLLDDVAQEELLEVARKLMEKNDCDLVLANDYQTVQAGASSHVGHLMSRSGKVESFTGKPAIADGIASAVEKIWKEEERK